MYMYIMYVHHVSGLICDIYLTSPRFEKARNILAENLARYDLEIRDWTSVAGGESNSARVDQILSYVTTADTAAWAVVDDEAAWSVHSY